MQGEMDAPGMRAVPERDVLRGRGHGLVLEAGILPRLATHTGITEGVERTCVLERCIVVVQRVRGRRDGGALGDACAVAERDVLRGYAMHGG